jgi:hypothetical protein
MSKSVYFCLIAVLYAGLFVKPTFGQTSNEDPRNTSTQASIEPSAVNNEDTVKKGEEEQTQYATALDGTGLISLDRGAPSHLLFGATVAGGWDSNPDNLSNGIASGVLSFSPYVGIQANTPKTQYLLQYQPTITGFSSNSYIRQTMNIASARIIGTATDRWSWDIKAMASYGQDSVRFLGSQQTVAVGEVPGTGPNSASYLPNAGTVTYADGGLGVRYMTSERDSVEFRGANTFSHYTGLNESNNIATTTLTYDRDLSPTLGLLAYGQNAYYYGSLHCESYGGGVGLRWRPSEMTTLSLSAGPQLNTSTCGSQQGFSHSASYSTRLSRTSQIYLLSARQPTTSYLGPGLWQESASGGYQQQVGSVGTVSFDVGYVASTTLATISSYHGTYFDFVYGYRLGHGLRASYSYRGYVGDSGGDHFTRNVALFSFAWTPAAGHVFQ